MSKFFLGPRSLLRLRGIHPDLVAVVKHAIACNQIDFTVVCGLRSKERQMEHFLSGASKTLQSRHLTGHAVDLAPYVAGKVVWNTPAFHPLVALMKTSAHILGVTLRCGADFNDGGTTGSRWVDMPHFELPRWRYSDVDRSHHSEKARVFLATGKV